MDAENANPPLTLVRSERVCTACGDNSTHAGAVGEWCENCGARQTLQIRQTLYRLVQGEPEQKSISFAWLVCSMCDEESSSDGVGDDRCDNCETSEYLEQRLAYYELVEIDLPQLGDPSLFRDA